MADNILLNLGSGGDTVAADEISSVKYPRGKITLGAEGANDGDVCVGYPMPTKMEGASILAAGVSCTIKFAAIAAASSGNNTIVSAVSAKKVRILSLCIVAASAVSLYFVSASGGTVVFGGSTNKISLAANGGFVLPYNPGGWFENASTNQDLIMNLSSAVIVSGGCTYIEV